MDNLYLNASWSPPGEETLLAERYYSVLCYSVCLRKNATAVFETYIYICRCLMSRLFVVTGQWQYLVTKNQLCSLFGGRGMKSSSPPNCVFVNVRVVVHGPRVIPFQIFQGPLENTIQGCVAVFT